MTLADGRDWIRRNPAAAVILVLGAVLRLVLLTRQSLWHDEAVTLVIAQAPERTLSLMRALESNPPLHELLMRWWLPLWSDPLLGLRAFSVCCGIAALPLYWSLCRRLLPAQAPLAFFLAGCSSLWIHASQTGRCYAWFILLAIAQTHLAWRLRGSWSDRAAALYGLLAVCGLYTHYYYHLLVFALGLSLLWEPGFRARSLTRWLFLHAAVWLAFLPWLPMLRAQSQVSVASWVLSERLSPGFLAQVFGTFLFDASYLGLALQGWTRALGWASWLLAAAGLWRLRGRMTSPEAAAARFCLINITVPVAAAVAVECLHGRPVCQPRYLAFLPIFFFPLLALAVERGFSGAWSRASRLLLAVVAAVGVAAYFTSNIVIDPRLAGSSALIRRALDRRAPIIHWSTLEYAPWRYYYLPERAHFLLDLTPADAAASWDWPGYAGRITPRQLAALPLCLVIDPERRLSSRRIGFGSGARLLERAGIRPPGPAPRAKLSGRSPSARP